MFDKSHLNILICPNCKKAEWSSKIFVSSDNSIQEAELLCVKCENKVRVENGIPNFLSEKDYNSDIEWEKKCAAFINWRKKVNKNLFTKSEKTINQKLISDFISFCKPFGKVLDIGCGDGGLRNLLEGIEYYGIDPIICLNKYEFPFFKAIGESIPFISNFFDGIFLAATLDHTFSPEKVIEEANRVLNLNGYLYFLGKIKREMKMIDKSLLYIRKFLIKLASGNFTDLKRGFDLVVLKKDDPYHLHHFDEDTLLQLLKSYFVEVDIKIIYDTIILKAQKIVNS